MAGNTGKMTNEAIEERGPRMVLTRLGENGYFIYREDKPCFFPNTATTRHIRYGSRSYSRSYLLRIGRISRMMP